MNKKGYLTPQIKVIQVEANAILAGSTGATIPDAGWGNANQRQHIDDILEESGQ